MSENILQSLIASASDITNSTSGSGFDSNFTGLAKTKVIPETGILGQRIGKSGTVVSNILKTDIIPDKGSSVSLGHFNKSIKKLYVDEIYVKQDGIKFVDNTKVVADENTITYKAALSYNKTIDETKFLINEQDAKVASASLDIKNNVLNQEHFEISIVSNSFGYGLHRKSDGTIPFISQLNFTSSYASYEFNFTTSSLSGGLSAHPSGSDIQIQTSNTGSVSKFVEAFNGFRNVSSSIFPLTASIESSSTTPFSGSVIRLTSTITGNRRFGITNYVSSSEATPTGSLSFLNSPSGYLGEGKITGSNPLTIDTMVIGGTALIQTGSFQFGVDRADASTKNLLRISSSEDILQLGEENEIDRSWKFKKDGTIAYSPANSSDTFTLNVSESLIFAKEENFGKGTKTEFSKTKGDTDPEKRITDIDFVRLPYGKGIQLVTKTGQSGPTFGITTTDMSSSKNSINRENVVRFKGAGGYSFQNGIGNAYFHIDAVGQAAFGTVGVVNDHWDASANVHITGSKTNNIFRVSTDKDVINIKDNTVNVSGSLSISGSIQGNLKTMTNHAYYDNSYGERNWLPFTPFGTSETNMWTSSRDNVHRFIAPHNGQLTRLMVRNNYITTSSLGSTVAALTVFPQLTGSEEITKNVDFNTGVDFDFVSSSFNKGDLLGVYLQPSGSPRYVNITCVWEYDTRS